jgi:hypothetical protein
MKAIRRRCNHVLQQVPPRRNSGDVSIATPGRHAQTWESTGIPA